MWAQQAWGEPKDIWQQTDQCHEQSAQEREQFWNHAAVDSTSR